VVMHVADDALRLAEAAPAIGGIREEDRRLHEGAIARIEHEPRETDVDAIAVRAFDVPVGGDPGLVVDDRRRCRGTDERGRLPHQRAGRVEGPLVYRDRVRRGRAVEAGAAKIHASAAVEGERWISARIVGTAGYVLHTGNQRSMVVGVAARTAPRLPTVVRVVRSG